MGMIVLDASKNKDYLEKHGELIDQIEDEKDETSSVRKREIREVYIPPEEIENLMEMYNHVVVQDFEDEYHMSFKEREEMRSKFEKLFRLKKKFTKKIRKLDVYVEACRLCLDIIKDTAKTNGIYDPDEFVAMVLKGQASINGLNFPKFQGKGKKTINWEYVAEFILDKDRDVRELVDRDELAYEESNVTAETIFGDHELESILEPLSQEEEIMRSGAIFNPEDLNGECADYMTKKDRKALIKIFPGYVKEIKQMKKKVANARENAKIWQLDSDQMQFIEEYDAKIRGKKSASIPEFHGNASKQSDVDAYLYAVNQWEEENTLVEFNGRYITMEELHDLQYKNMLEEAGWNLRNLYDNKEKEKRLAKAKESDRKRIKKLKNMLAEIQERSDRRDSGDDDYASGTKINKKKKKKDKKAKKKAKKYNEILMDAVDAEDENMKMYMHRMEKMKWGED